MSLSFSRPTALLLIDNQKGLACDPNTPCHWGTHRSTPSLYTNLHALLTAFRTAKSKKKPTSNLQIIHVLHSSTSPTSPLHAAANNGTNIQPLEIVAPAPDGSEPVFWKNVNSAFVGTTLESFLRGHGIRQLVVAGMSTDHCVSSTVRMAADLGVLDRYRGNGKRAVVHADGTQEAVEVEKGRIVVVRDATAAWAKGRFRAETVHAVNLASLDGEFADILDAEEVLEELGLV
ncbi:Isochorismatase-like protein [Aspergillus egyptiacus]|nr:Isochorismatase-like protein [Aspergillus egyptiacus]